MDVTARGGVAMRQAVLTSIAVFLRSRRRQIIWALLLGAAGLTLLVEGARVSGYGQEIMVNVGASFVMVALSFVVFVRGYGTVGLAYHGTR